MKRLDEVIDRINRMHGSEMIVLGSQQYTQKNGKGKAEVFANAIKHDYKSPNPLHVGLILSSLIQMPRKRMIRNEYQLIHVVMMADGRWQFFRSAV